MTEQIRVSVIVPTHNHAKYLKDAIVSLQNQDFSKDEYEIIVVDNCCTDTTEHVIAEVNKVGKQALCFYEQELGLHNARHRGAIEARGEILAFGDDDATYSPSWLKEIVKPFIDNRVGCVGGRVLPKWEEFPPKWVMHKNFLGPLSLLDISGKVKETKDIYGVNFSIRKTLLFQLHGFNPDSFGNVWLGDGETGLLKKVRRAKYKVMYTPYALCFHVIPKQRMTQRYFNQRFANQGACDSYASYKEFRHSKTILYRQIAYHCLKAGKLLMLLLPRLTSIRDSWHFNLSQLFYYWRRIAYDYRLISDGKLREFVLRDDWLK